MKRISNLLRWLPAVAACVVAVPSAEALDSETRKQFNFEPPRVIVSEEPARLMLIDGPPAPVPIAGTELEFVVNTDWTVFHDRRSDDWYLLDDGAWLRNTMLASGRWFAATELPRDFLTLQVGSDWPEVAEAMPPRAPEAPPLPLIISYEPTVLVLVDGSPVTEAIGDSGLQYVSNTDSNLFVLDDRYYLMLAGRWFTTRDLRRRWYAVEVLPSEFTTIPEDHPRGRVLAAVPGTEAARRAADEAAEARTAVIDSTAVPGLTVPWFGEPSFVPVEGTGLLRGENTPYQVIRHNNFFYLCHEGAWYASSNPQGPWKAAHEVPEAIYTIPPTDPAYNVTFVRLESFDDSTGRAAYTSTGGYRNRYWTGSTVIYGTGWYHPGYYDRSAYWRYPYSYGYWGPYWGHGWAYPYSRSETFDLKERNEDWEWSLDGSKRRVYRYGPQNVVGGKYVMPESNIYKGDGRERPRPRR
jgi:hypothetical protein